MARVVPVPTRRLLTIAALMLGTAAIAPFVPLAATLWRIMVLITGVAVVIEWVTRPKATNLKVTRIPPTECRVGRPSHYTTRVENTGERLVDVAVRDVPPVLLDGPSTDTAGRLRGGDHIDLRTEFTPLERGPIPLLPVGIGYRHAFGLLEFRTSADPESTLAVAPGRPSGELSVLLSRVAAVQEPGSTPMRRLGGEWEFESLREYQVGDEIRTIDWRASARRHMPVTRQFEIERTTEIVLAIDVGRIMGSRIHGVRKADYAMTALLDLAAVASQNRERVGLLAFDSAPRAYLPPRTGWRHLDHMTRELAAIDQRDVATSYLRAVALLDQRHRRRCLAVIFTDFLDEITGAEMFATLTALRKRHELLFVAVGDPHVEEVFDAEPNGEAGLFEKSVAAQLIVERERAVQRIRDLGISVVDADPRRISAPLIRRYLDLRHRTMA